MENDILIARAVEPGVAKVTEEWLKGLIVNVDYIIMPSGLTTICELTLANGFTVRGESSVVSAANFKEELGQKYAYENAFDKLWAYEGYLLKQRLFERQNDDIDTLILADHIAEVAHEVNRAYCQALGDDSQVSWDRAPKWQKDSALGGVAFHTDNPDAGAAASHENWRAQKVLEGWVYGPVKDSVNKEHPCMVPFEQLPVEQQAKDWLLRGVVHAMNDIFNRK